MKPPATLPPESLFRLAASLLQHKLIGLDDIYPLLT
jgi:hypothetical protein